ncbi:MAG: ParB N-terminal domain-containing protein [Desulfobulbaceae bacterium]|nr:ParB N-terminal domain-containing protein [Desulfobulbaceae bacterium]
MHRLPHSDFINIPSINLADRTYHLCPFNQTAPEKELIESIRQFGILHPPILKQRKSNIIIVDGRKRILAARLVRPDDKIMCLVIPEEAEEEFAYKLIVEETSCGRQLSLVEQATLFDNFLKLKPVEDALPLLEKLGYKPQKHILDELVSLLTLSSATLLAIHKGIILPKSARKMRKLSAEDQELLVQLISSLHLGGSKQHKLIDYCTELIMRTNIPLKKLLHEFIADDIQDNNKNIPQQSAALLMWLHKKCFPRSTKAEDEFRKSVAGLCLPEHIHIDHQPSFEDDSVTLSVKFPDLKTVHKALPEILEIARNS